MADNNGRPPLPGSELIELREKAYDAQVVRRSVVEPNTSGIVPASGTDSLLLYVASAADTITPWGRAPKLRDKQLRNFFPQENFLMGALGTVSVSNAAFSWKLEGDEQTVEAVQDMLVNANRGDGWEDFISKVSMDLYSQDNGAFVEFIRAGDGPEYPVLNIAHLDSDRCYQTGDPKTPVIYRDRKGRFHELRWYQVAHLQELPSGQEVTHAGVFYSLQYCAVTRVLSAAQIMREISIYRNEKVSGRFTRAVQLLKGVTPQQVREAMAENQNEDDNRGLMRFGTPVMVASVSPTAEIGHDTVELASLPDNFDPEKELKNYLIAIQLGFLREYQDFAPLPGGNLGTSAQSEMLNMKSRGKGKAMFMKLIAHMMNFRGALPRNVQFSWDEQDIEAEKTQAELENMRAEGRSKRIQSGELDPEGARQIALDTGDLKEETYAGIVEREQQRQEQEQVISERDRNDRMAVDVLRFGGPQDAGTDNDVTARDMMRGSRALVERLCAEMQSGLGMKDDDDGPMQLLADLLQTRIHRAFTDAADDLAALGYMSTGERIELSGIIGDTLQFFAAQAGQLPIATALIAHDDIKRLIKIAEKEIEEARKRRWPTSRRKLEEAVTDDMEALLDGVFTRITARLDQEEDPGAEKAKRRGKQRPRVVEEQSIERDPQGRFKRSRTVRYDG